jgi:hypothetical protein
VVTEYNVPPAFVEQINQIKKRLDALERRKNPLPDVDRPEIVFSYSGALAVSESMQWTRRETGVLVEVLARVRVAGGSDTVIEVQKNGTTEVTVTIPADQTWVKIPCAVSFSADQDVLHDVLTTVGSGAMDLTVQHRFRARP